MRRSEDNLDETFSLTFMLVLGFKLRDSSDKCPGDECLFSWSHLTALFTLLFLSCDGGSRWKLLYEKWVFSDILIRTICDVLCTSRALVGFFFLYFPGLLMSE